MEVVGCNVTLFALGSGNWVAGGQGCEEGFYCIPFVSFELECIFHLKNKK